MVGQMPRPQLLGVVTGKVPSEVHLLGLGRRCMERYTPEPDLCRHCHHWEHKEWRCQSVPRCRYCASPISQHSTWTRSRRAPKSLLCAAIVGATIMPTPPSALSGLGPKGSLLLMRLPAPTTDTSTTPAVFPPLPQHAATVPPVPPKTVPQLGITQELPATDSTQQLMAVVSTLAARVDNLSATVSAFSNEFATFKNQQHTVCSETPTVASTPSPVNGTKQDQGESDVCQHSLCNPLKKKVNAAGQCGTAAAPSPRIDAPPPSQSREPHNNPAAPQEWLLLSLPQKASHLRQTVMRILQVNGNWSAARRSAAPAQFQPGLPAPSQTRGI
ncbi:hypothetical protein E2C01_078895 [Portunus trituberculatus]|uniref:Uncharacterized protein n=1 Tax=Portunus trituberculatus TaxID=210409 RepID=A0A5B7IRF3_PORTR|nr:hypothetical protein [Portunus trituberculatus]